MFIPSAFDLALRRIGIIDARGWVLGGLLGPGDARVGVELGGFLAGLGVEREVQDLGLEPGCRPPDVFAESRALSAGGVLGGGVGGGVDRPQLVGHQPGDQ